MADESQGMPVFHIDEGGTLALTAEVLKGAAATGTLPDPLLWSSQDDGTATVEGSGGSATVTAKAMGSTVVTVSGRLASGALTSAACKVRVHSPTEERLTVKGPEPAPV